MGAPGLQSTSRQVLVLVTAPNLEVARRLARLGLESRLCACANLVPSIESHYWWQGQIESSAEVLILFKTSRRQLRRLESTIVMAHPYDTPEFVVVSLSAGNRRYLQWIDASTGAPPPSKRSERPVRKLTASARRLRSSTG